MDLRRVHPLSDEPDDRQLFDEWLEVRNASQTAIFGVEHSSWSAEEMRGRRRGITHRFTDVAAIEGERVVGMLSLAEPLHDNPELALVMLAVHPDARRRGAGSAMLAEAERAVREHGRRVVQVDTEWRSDQQDDSGEGFAAGHGYSAGQTTIRSRMALPADRHQLQTLATSTDVEDAAAFEIEASWDGVPEAWLDDLAVLEQRMSTDAPQGDLQLEEEEWDAERVRADLQWALDAGRRLVVVVARDLSVDRLVGFTQAQVSAESPTLAYQQDTLVLREARGNRLGLRLKARAALELMDELPDVRGVRTWNADDNTHMLAVNAELGYVPEGHLRVWEKRLT
ncbi:GNAT family N-acetyltransferase [Luteipulveratus sp. YIM 133132]|uniref:GNAT family N-acetyltransferase n=1 Tax=Luteipulveratus flavus TaxID=3031728 RepID=UPI0023AEE799|nr:GNAT family N-acetyltransferase [Luteipulveratus sp. YIM 133132]MDE9367221.1 GNAT family N-acetyltransferase [Luteipulveratus sp. YIM 133132]